jgi:hypothetical protein
MAPCVYERRQVEDYVTPRDFIAAFDVKGFARLWAARVRLATSRGDRCLLPLLSAIVIRLRRLAGLRRRARRRRPVVILSTQLLLQQAWSASCE